jgi:hypothetical protein
MENQTQNQSEVQTEAQTGTKSIKIEDLKTTINVLCSHIDRLEKIIDKLRKQKNNAFEIISNHLECYGDAELETLVNSFGKHDMLKIRVENTKGLTRKEKSQILKLIENEKANSIDVDDILAIKL